MPDLGVSTSGYYDWFGPRQRRAGGAGKTPSCGRRCVTIHRQSRGTYGSPRVHAELRLGVGIHVGRKRLERFVRAEGLKRGAGALLAGLLAVGTFGVLDVSTAEPAAASAFSCTGYGTGWRYGRPAQFCGDTQGSGLYVRTVGAGSRRRSGGRASCATPG
jgi:hypothetical protein